MEKDVEESTNRNRGGCLRGGMVFILGLAALLFAAAFGFLLVSYLTIDRTVIQPIEALSRVFGAEATPVIRPDTVTIVREINNLAQLQTASYQVEKIITAEGGNDRLFGLFEDSLIFVAFGEVTGGIDLAKLTENDIRVSGFQTATLRLPPAEVFIVKVDSERSYVADRDVGLGARIRQPDAELETLARQAAEREIFNAAIDQGLLEVADQNAKDVLTGLLKSLGFEAVVFVDGELPPPVPFEPERPKGFVFPDS